MASAFILGRTAHPTPSLVTHRLLSPTPPPLRVAEREESGKGGGKVSNRQQMQAIAKSPGPMFPELGFLTPKREVLPPLPQ